MHGHDLVVLHHWLYLANVAAELASFHQQDIILHISAQFCTVTQWVNASTQEKSACSTMVLTNIYHCSRQIEYHGLGHVAATTETYYAWTPHFSECTILAVTDSGHVNKNLECHECKQTWARYSLRPVR